MQVLLVTAIGAFCIAFLCGFVTAWKLRDAHEAQERELSERAAILERATRG